MWSLAAAGAAYGGEAVMRMTRGHDDPANRVNSAASATPWAPEELVRLADTAGSEAQVIDELRAWLERWDAVRSAQSALSRLSAEDLRDVLAARRRRWGGGS